MNAREVQMLARDRLMVAGLVFCVAVLSITGWVLLGGGAGAEKGKGAYTHMHCPDCLEEFKYNPQVAGKACPACGPRGARLVPTVGSLADGAGEVGWGSSGKGLVFGVIALVLVQAYAYLGVLRLAVVRRVIAESTNRLLVCRCPFCNRKIGYTAKKIGVGATCPRCKTAFILPPGTPEESLAE